MKLPRLDTETAISPVLEELLAERGRQEPLAARDRLVDLTLAVVVFAASIAIAAAWGSGHVDIGPAIAMRLSVSARVSGSAKPRAVASASASAPIRVCASTIAAAA